jgi:hypothetical protein
VGKERVGEIRSEREKKMGKRIKDRYIWRNKSDWKVRSKVLTPSSVINRILS